MVLPCLPLRSSSPLHSFSAAPFFCRHPGVQNTLLSHGVKWSALFLVPSSNNMEQAPRFYSSRILCQFLQIFLESLSLFKNVSFSPLALRCPCLCAGVCVYVCVCGCVGGCLRLCECVQEQQQSVEQDQFPYKWEPLLATLLPSRDGNLHGLGVSHATTTSPKLSFRALRLTEEMLDG